MLSIVHVNTQYVNKPVHSCNMHPPIDGGTKIVTSDLDSIQAIRVPHRLDCRFVSEHRSQAEHSHVRLTGDCTNSR